jgi:hypothetical protein
MKLRIGSAALLAVVAALSLGSAAFAQKQQTLPPNLPTIVQDAMQTHLKECEAGEKPLYKPGFLTVRDINGDGKPDYILDYDHFQCGERVSMFCGTGGCQREIFASEEEKGYVPVWNKLARKVTFLTLAKRPAMRIDIHGTLCGRNGGERCTLTLYWNGSEFHPAN